MGILSTLLTGGALVGKVCQSLAGALTATDEKTGIQVSLSELNIGGVKFMRSNANGNGMQTYAFNSNTTGQQSVAFPNIDGGGGAATMLLGPGDKRAVDNFMTENVAPDTNIAIGPATVGATGTNDGNETLRWIFKGLKWGEQASAGEVDVSMNTTHLLIVCATITIISLSYIFVKGRNGTQLANADQQKPKKRPRNAGNALTEYRFDIPFLELGFGPEEVLDEVIISAQTSKATSHALTAGNMKLHPVELKLIAELEEKINKKRK